MSNRERWTDLCARLGCVGLAERFDELAAAYGESHRRYHTLQHIGECLAYLDRVEPLAAEPAELEAAIWLHDVVYATRRDDNEARSAAVAAAWLEAAGADGARTRRVRELILATRHDMGQADGDAALLQDIDLNVLGSESARYDEYEAQIREEYRWVPGPVFRRRRAEILRGFLERDRIFNTRWFEERLEATARSNLARALRVLEPGHSTAEVVADGSAGDSYRPFPDLEYRNTLQRHLEVPLFAWALRLPRGGRVLEVGCGAGAALPTLHRILTPALLVGIDIDAGLLARVPPGGSAAAVLRADARRLPFAADAFDVVVDFGTCYHVDDPDGAVGEIARVLRRGGVFATETKVAQTLGHPLRTRGRWLDPVGTGAGERRGRAGMGASYRRR